MSENSIDLTAEAEPIAAAEAVEAPGLLLARQAWLELHAQLSDYTRRRAGAHLPRVVREQEEGRS